MSFALTTERVVKSRQSQPIQTYTPEQILNGTDSRPRKAFVLTYTPWQSRNDAVELKLKVLDDKLLRAQISEEDKLRVNLIASHVHNCYLAS